jgi:SAM-dependent methyltransferase
MNADDIAQQVLLGILAHRTVSSRRRGCAASERTIVATTRSDCSRTETRDLGRSPRTEASTAKHQRRERLGSFTTNLRRRDWLLPLEALCRRWVRRSATVVEVGCFAGESTLVFARHAERVVAVDPWRENYRSQAVSGCRGHATIAWLRAHPIAPMHQIERLFDSRLAPYDNVSKVKMTSRSAASIVPDRSVDFVYIDALHTYRSVTADIALWLPKLKPTGVIAGHDYSPASWPDVVRAVHDRLGRPDQIYSDTSWVTLVRGRLRA